MIHMFTIEYVEELFTSVLMHWMNNQYNGNSMSTQSESIFCGKSFIDLQNPSIALCVNVQQENREVRLKYRAHI